MLAVVVLWVATARRPVLYAWANGLTATSGFGTFGIMKQYVWKIPSSETGWHVRELGFSGPMQWWFRGEWDEAARGVVVPWWAVCLPLVIATGIAWRRDVVAGRRGCLGKCGACGYDRGGLGAEAPCPECGVKCE